MIHAVSPLSQASDNAPVVHGLTMLSKAFSVTDRVLRILGVMVMDADRSGL